MGILCCSIMWKFEINDFNSLKVTSNKTQNKLQAWRDNRSGIFSNILSQQCCKPRHGVHFKCSVSAIEIVVIKFLSV